MNKVKKNIIIIRIIIIITDLFIYFATHVFLALVKDYSTHVTLRSSQLFILLTLPGKIQAVLLNGIRSHHELHDTSQPMFVPHSDHWQANRKLVTL